MSVHSQRNRLGALMKELMGRWSETKLVWRDAKAAEFEKLEAVIEFARTHGERHVVHGGVTLARRVLADESAGHVLQFDGGRGHGESYKKESAEPPIKGPRRSGSAGPMGPTPWGGDGRRPARGVKI